MIPSLFCNFFKISIRAHVILAILFLVGCGVKVELPTAIQTDTPISGANDTTYIRISPDWDASNGYVFSSPWDVIVGADGYLFVADHDHSNIHVISAAGSEVLIDAFGNDFTALTNMTDPAGAFITPMAIAQDDRLNLFVADSSNRLVVWNQYLNNVGVDSIAVSIQMRSPMAEMLWVADYDSIGTLQAEGWTINDVEWSDQGLEQWLAPRLFWDAGDSLEAHQIERYYIDPDSVRVTGVSSNGDLCLVADAYSNSILGLTYVPAALLMTGTGDEVLVYRGTMTERTVSTGTGNGTVNDPRGMTHDKSGALYYAQWGENFSVHKVGGNSGFEYGVDDIMEIERYDHASDVCLDQLGNIYVADTGHDLVQQFSSSGGFMFNIGVSRVFVDSTIMDSILIGSEYQVVERDTTFQVEVADILQAPRSVAIDATGIVYIADTQNDRIMRYRLSTEFDYDTDN
ncbi:MAG: hypothetical protein U9Q77_00575 [Candidatus Marinimicrobia bacterium]|nr:hypothetical protein [Candidatus Neomarinimicrobiota bacterium]